MAVALGLGACSSEDDNSLYTIVNKNESAIYSMTDYEDFYNASYDEQGQIEWKATSVDGYPQLMQYIVVTDKDAWTDVLSIGMATAETSLVELYEVYCEESGYDKEYLYPYEFKPAIDYKTVMIGGDKCEVLDRTENSLTVSLVWPWSVEDDKWMKSICYYQKRKATKEELKRIVPCENRQAAQIEMIKRVRVYYGDAINMAEHSPYYDEVVNLALMEEDIINGKYSGTEKYFIK